MGGRIHHEFEDVVNSLSEDEQSDVNAKVILLQKLGQAFRAAADLIHLRGTRT